MVDNNPDMYFVNCYRCGKYRIHDYVIEDHLSEKLTHDKRGNLSAWVYHNQVATILRKDFIRITQLPSLSVDEKAQRVLIYLSQKFPIPGQKINDLVVNFKILNDSVDKEEFKRLRDVELLDILSYSWISDIEELKYILQEYLLASNYIAHKGFIRILPAGWRYIEELKSQNTESNKIFIAMRFKDVLLNFFDDYIEPAIREAGYDPIRIDKHVHDNIIDDEIIASIRKSKLIVSDFTDNSSGVYFETGFARGLNLPVIYLCEKQKFEDEKHKPHFDVNHYPFLLWEENKGEKIRRELQLRIEALVGKGLLSSFSE